MDKILKKELVKYTIPGILGLLANSLYIVVDGIFVAKILGSKSLAAVTAVVPVVEILIAISLLISVGGGIYISICHGENNDVKARKYFNNGLYFTLIISIFILIVSLIFRTKFVAILGATPDIFTESVEYFTWFILFVPFFTLNYALGTWIRNDRKPELAMIGQIIGAVLNIVLDYVFMGPLQMGIKGAAIATGLGPIVGILILLPHFLRKKGSLYIEKIKLDWEYIKDIIISGIPTFTIEFALGIMSFLCNIFIASKLGANGLSSFGVIGYVNLIFLSIFLGIGQGTQPLISRYYGEKDTFNIQLIYKYTSIFSFIIGIIIYIILITIKIPIIKTFINSSEIEIINLTSKAITLFFFSYAITGVNVITANILSAKHSVEYSILISMLRSFVFLLPMLYFLSKFTNPMAIWLAVPIAELLTFPISYILINKDHKNTVEIFSKY